MIRAYSLFLAMSVFMIGCHEGQRDLHGSARDSIENDLYKLVRANTREDVALYKKSIIEKINIIEEHTVRYIDTHEKHEQENSEKAEAKSEKDKKWNTY